jgi:hypothetical protein
VVASCICDTRSKSHRLLQGFHRETHGHILKDGYIDPFHRSSPIETNWQNIGIHLRVSMGSSGSDRYI